MTQVHEVPIAGHAVLGRDTLVLIAGPCVIESDDHAIELGKEIAAVARRVGLPYVFKASFDKANRTSLASFRGPGLERGLTTLRRVRDEVGVPILTDIHEPWQAEPVAEVAEILQIPAFLSRQTDLIVAAARTGKVVNLKKGQFLAPQDIRHAVDKVRASGNERVFVTERGFSFGYNNLVVDMRGLAAMRDTGCPVVFDGTHSVQLPGGQGNASGGQREFIPVLARAAVGAGVSGVFMETHPKPDEALCDGPNSWPLHLMPELLDTLAALDRVVKRRGFVEEKVKGK
jgi:2-dehydro-3-deoxyphosphooctonate aldolase (KDO 8-P synthase)